MPGLPIAVEITPPDAPREHVTVLLAACGRASADAECVPAADVPVSGSRAVALVTWSGDRRVVIEVGLRKDGRSEWRSRTLDFERLDDPLERWRTIGFVVGTLSRPEATPLDSAPAEPEPAREEPAKTVEPEPTRAAAPVAPKPPAKAAPRAAVARDRPNEERRAAGRSRTGRPPGGTLDLGGVVGPGLEGTRAGALARGRFRLADVLGAVFAVRFLDRQMGEASFGGRWITGCAGVGVELGSEVLTIAAAVDVRGEYFEARARDTARTDAEARFLSGVGVGVNGGWMPMRHLGLFVGGEAAAMFGTTDVRVREVHVATDEAVRFAVEGGVRVRLW